MFYSQYYKLVIAFYLFIHVTSVFASSSLEHNSQSIPDLENKINVLLREHVLEKHDFYGLAFYYNQLNYFIADQQSLSRIDTAQAFKLNDKQWLVVLGRYNALVVQLSNLSGKRAEESFIFNATEVLDASKAKIYLFDKKQLLSFSNVFEQARYLNLWYPLAWLAKATESFLVFIQQNFVSSWGWCIIIFAFLLKIVTLPISLMVTSSQHRVDKIRSELNPKLASIKQDYDGEEAHNRLMSAHSDLGISPFYTLKPMLGMFIQIPILIVVFNTLGEIPQLNGQAFLWIESLSSPDRLSSLPFSIPFLGNRLSLLPFIMFTISIFAAFSLKTPHSAISERRQQKLRLYLMSFAFFIIFYPFPSALVLYWSTVNLLQILQQQIIKT